MTVLQRLRVTDEQGRLSLTNLAVFVAIAKLAAAPGIDYSAVAVFITAIASYQYKASR